MVVAMARKVEARLLGHGLSLAFYSPTASQLIEIAVGVTIEDAREGSVRLRERVDVVQTGRFSIRTADGDPMLGASSGTREQRVSSVDANRGMERSDGVLSSRCGSHSMKASALPARQGVADGRGKV